MTCLDHRIAHAMTLVTVMVLISYTITEDQCIP